MFAWVRRLFRRPKSVMRVLFPYPSHRGDWHMPVRASSDSEAIRLLERKHALRLVPAVLTEPNRKLDGYRESHSGRFYVLRPLPSQSEMLKIIKELELHDLLSIPPDCPCLTQHECIYSQQQCPCQPKS